MVVPSRYLVLLAVSSFILSVQANGQDGYYTWPSADDNTLVFTAEGDLWRLDEGATQAIRLTTHDELESQAALSPDGTQIAFGASFDSNRQVYVMPTSGGAPRQLTFESVGVSIRGWSPDGRILYTSRNIEGSSRVRELRLVDPDSGEIERIPLRYATTGSFDDDNRYLYFTRHGIATVNDSARLYRGGGMSQLWRFDLRAQDEAQRLAANFEGPIEDPMFWDDRIYFISDESGYDNVWSMDTDGDDIQQHTRFAGWRLRGAKMHEGVVHYQRGADIYAYDIDSREERLIEINLASDRDRTRLRWIEDPVDFLTSAQLASDAKRVALGARGQVTVTGIDEQRRVDLPIPARARARHPTPDSKAEWIYAIIDEDERGEIWRFRADGSGEKEQLTSGADDHRWRFVLSPDDKWLVHTDKAARLFKLNLETRENTLISQSFSGSDDDFAGFDFSPDGRYVAYRTTGARYAGSVIAVHDLEGLETVQITTEKYSSYAPAFSKDGEWLYFVSERNFNATPGAPWGDRNMGVQFDRRGQLFALALSEDAVFPFAPTTELTATLENGDEEEEEENGSEESTSVAIDWNAASQRLFQVPVPSGNYELLQASSDRLYVLDRSGNSFTLKSLPITNEDPEFSNFASNVIGYHLTEDGESLFYRTRGNNPTLAIVPAGEKAPEDLGDFRLRTRGWRLPVDQSVEWEQMFLDGWRMHRDFAFDPTLRGVDWDEVRERLEPLLPRLGHRTDLADLFGQMAAEMGILHSQVNAGELPSDDENGNLSSLGARYQPVNNGLQIVQIYQGEVDRPGTLGPLQKPGVDVEVGDVIVAINNRDVSTRGELEAALMFQSGQQVLLDTIRDDEPLRNIVTPVTTGTETTLRYLDWSGDMAKKVEESTNGEIGYLHMRAMTASDVGSFARDFFPQNHLDGLILDVRDNNGGNIDSLIINQFLRKAWAFWQFEVGSPSYPNMQEVFRGHLAVLINAGTYSDGESFAAGIKALGIAPLIGERTAGAGIWLSDRNRLADGGMSRIAESPQFGLDGRWLIEGTGITPDIEVIAEPHALFNGNDQQLTAAIEYLQQKIEDEPIPELRALPLPPMGERGRDVSD